MSVNKQLSSFDRYSILRDLGFDVNRTSGQVTGIKNIAYDDQNPDLSINLDTGLVRDFGNSEFDGDVIDLIQKTTGYSFKKTVKFIEEKLNKNLSSMDGMQQCKLLYEDTDVPNPKKSPSKKMKKFWDRSKWDSMVKCKEVLESKGIPESMEFIKKYDGIDKDTLLEHRCGIYGYKDFEFGTSGKNYNDVPFFVFPYRTGAMIYRRNKDGRKFFDKKLPKGKEVKNIKGSSTDDSFFNINKDDVEQNVIFIMKSPRECMNFSMYNKVFKIISVITGEEIGGINRFQKDQLSSIISKNKSEIYLIFDCDNPDDYDKSLKSTKIFAETFPDSLVGLVNIYKHTEGKHKDFTDLVRYSMKKGTWDFDKKEYNLQDDLGEQFAKAISNPQLIK